MDTSKARFVRNSSLGILAWAFSFCSFGQYPSDTITWKKLISIEKDTSLTNQQKLQQVHSLEKQCKDRKMTEDSVYARILHRIGQLEFVINDRVATKNAITSTLLAIRINKSGKKNSAPAFCVNSYTNLGNYYKSVAMYDVAAQYYDSAVILRKQFYVREIPEIILLLEKAQMLYVTGDYQKAIEGFTVAILKARAANDSAMLPGLLNQRAQSRIIQGRLEEALKDVSEAIALSKHFDLRNEAINSMIIQANIFTKQKDFLKVVPLYKNAIKARIETGEDTRIAMDYIILGNFYLLELKDYSKAKDCFLETISYAQKARNPELSSMALINLQLLYFKKGQLKESEHYCMEAMKVLKVTNTNNIFSNPSASDLSSIGNKELILVILGNKTELLLNQFKQTTDSNYLAACLRTTLLTDTLITKIRHEQSGEQSKLFWRKKTREFFTNALEACYLARNAGLAFYFMEKSRAVLLNDKLNELGAIAHLKETEVEKERQFQITVMSEQQKLTFLTGDEKAYEAQQAKLTEAKENFEHYIRSLEQNYPAYHQYKYADEVPSLDALQKQLLKNKQSFVHYFINDTVAYILGITPTDTKLIKLSEDDFDSRLLTKFLNSCSDEPTSIEQYALFISLSHTLYKLLFKPLQIPQGRVVICPDNFLIPFEALCSDNTGTNFLVNDYIFSYVYSARYLVKKYIAYQPKGDFIGFAPVTFKAYSQVADLRRSADALKQSASYYGNTELFTKNRATRENFLKAVSGYTIINIFSHAQADTSDNEPVLYLHDSTIYLSELQLLRNPATKLVVLSACQTNIGKNAKGEGIFSLARGFASAGIPSVAGTLWKADEESIYAISEKFNECLSQGMPKDEALQKAKIFFMRHVNHEKPFPYYWANMILIGNEQPIELSKKPHILWWIAGVIFITTIVFLVKQLFYNRARIKAR